MIRLYDILKDIDISTINLDHSTECIGYSLYFKRKPKFDREKGAILKLKELKGKLDTMTNLRVASKYPHIAMKYFQDDKGQTIEIIKLNGSVELAPLVGLSDVIVDIVETGKTLYENGLDVLEDVCPLSARFVVNKVSMKMETERIMNIVKQFEERITK